jgi:serine/threonine protein kinase
LLKKSDILKLGIQLIKSIRQLHSLGFVHLDLKPDNIMFKNEESEIKFKNEIQDVEKFESEELKDEEKRQTN